MADYPCDLHLARYKGPSTRAFVNVYRDDQMLCLRLSCCEQCLDELLAPWVPRAYFKTPEDHWDPLEEGEGLELCWMASERPRNGHGAPRRP